MKGNVEKRVLCFVDNDPTRLALIKHRSPSHERDGGTLLFVEFSYLFCICAQDTADFWGFKLPSVAQLDASFISVLAGTVPCAEREIWDALWPARFSSCLRSHHPRAAADDAWDS